MIKLIATDMDGTFLDSTKNFDMEFIRTYQQLRQKGIKFVIASGNQYQRLFQKFLPMSLDMVFIAENGSYIAEGSNELYTNTVNPTDAKKICDIFEQHPEVFIVLCGKKTAYIKNANKDYEEMIKLHYCAFQFVDSFDSLYDEDILKIAVYDPNADIKLFLEKIKDQLPESVKVVTSGNMWMDIQNKSINKGIAMKYLQDLYHIKPEECMAFGDQMNDYELLLSVKYSFAMGNAVDPIKEIAYDVCLDNENQGVIKKINEYLGI